MLEGVVRSEKAASCCGFSGQRFSMYARKQSFHVMRINMSDSLPDVNRVAGGFGIIIREPATPPRMQGNRDDVISSFVRSKIREWRESGRELQELARAAGFAKSTPSQVMLGTGVGAKTGPRFAKAFGYDSFDAMKSAAWEWWKAQGKAGHEAVTAPTTGVMRHAVEAVLSLNQGTPEQLQTIVSAYAHPRFSDRDETWWLQTLLAELDRDRLATRDDKQLRAEVTGKHREMRAATKQKQAQGVVHRDVKPAKRKRTG